MDAIIGGMKRWKKLNPLVIPNGWLLKILYSCFTQAVNSFNHTSTFCIYYSFGEIIQGSTGKPKGVLHTTGGYLLYASTTFKMVFDYKPGDVYWCTADIGWITGHSYVVYGPLANGATSVMVRI